MKKANILFDSLDLLAIHINKIRNNPEDWWNEVETKKQRTYFEKKALGINNKNSLNKWCEYLNKLKK